MKSRAARLTLLILFMVALGATAYLFWKGESLVGRAAASLAAFDTSAEAASRTVLDVRMAQQAYVASGQGGEFWSSKVTAGVQSLVATLDSLKGAAVSPQAAAEIETARGIIGDFTQLDRRAREYARSGQNLLASDLIFSDGLELTEGMSARLSAALREERAARDAEIQTLRQRQVFALAAAAAAALLVVLLLYPRVEEDFSPASLMGRGALPAAMPMSPGDFGADLEIETDAWSPPRRMRDEASSGSADLQTEDNGGPQTAEAIPAAQDLSRPETAPPAGAAAADFNGLASLCTDLARVMDTQQLPGLLERASSLLDASGIILWIADPDARELNPIMAQGYPPQLLNRLGALPRDAENATAAAFRTSLLQTVKGDGTANGAIAAPLVTSSGCVGVMAAEVRNEAEQQDGKLAAAAIMAAQLATLVGPPASRNGRAEAAGA